MTTSLDAAQSAATRALRDGGIATPALDARVLLKSATGLPLETLIAKGREPLPPEAATRFKDFVSRRLAGEPVSRIRCVREFFGRDFQIDPSTLDPRPDTETLIATVLDIVDRHDRRGRPLRVLDLGTGSGCILVTLLAEVRNAQGLGVDIAAAALQRARANARTFGVEDRARFVVADWFCGLGNVDGGFDIVVSNPPYVATGEIEFLAPEVSRHDPRTALDGGPDGLDAYRRIAKEAAGFLAPGGHIVVEIGYTQAQAVTGLFLEGLTVDGAGIVADLAGLPRCVHAFKPAAEGVRNPGARQK